MPLRESVEAILEEQFAIARRYQAKGGYYPHAVIDAIRSAAVCAQDAAHGALNRSANAREIAAAVASAGAQWLRDNEDEDGYGSATLQEIERALRAL